MKKMIGLLLLMMVWTSSVWAEDVSLQATVSSHKISLKEAAELTLTVTGAKNNLDPINLPAIDGFDTRYLGPSTSISIVNGNYSSQRSFTYNLFPSKTGHFQIPAVTANINGQNYTTKPIDLDVVDGPAQEDTSLDQGQSQVPTADSLKDKVLLTMSTTAQEFYLNEKIPLTIKLLVRDIPVRDIQMPQIDLDGFLMDGYQNPRQYSQDVNGLRYDVVEFKTFIYPTHSGQEILMPAHLQANVIYETTQKNPFSNSALGDAFFSSFMNSYAAKPITVSSNELKFNVLPLPDGQPADFSGAVGQFNFTATASPTEVNAGDPVTIHMSITGAGNLKSAHIPVFNDSHFKIYDPQVKDQDNGKTIEQVVIPSSEDVKEIPVLNFTYFDTLTKEYKTLSQGPFTIKVNKLKADQDFKAVGFSDMTQPKAQSDDKGANPLFFRNLGKGIWFWIQKFAHSVAFWSAAALIILLSVGWMIWIRFNERLRNDSAFSRRHNAYKKAKHGLKEASSALASNDSKGFYTIIFNVLNNYIADKTNKPTGSLSHAQIIAVLKERGLEEADIRSTENLLNTCDFVRFASASQDASKMQTDLTQVNDLIGSLEKRLK